MSRLVRSEESSRRYREHQKEWMGNHPLDLEKESAPPGEFAKRNTFRALGDVASDFRLDGTKAKLKELDGDVRTSFQFGLAGLRERAIALGVIGDGVANIERLAEAELARGCSVCESPIERTLLGALIAHHWKARFLTIPPLVHLPKDDHTLPAADLIILPQFAFAKMRVDFAVVSRSEEGRICQVFVECDGQDFHKDADKDRMRDAYARSWGIPTVRIKGSDISADAEAAAGRVERELLVVLNGG